MSNAQVVGLKKEVIRRIIQAYLSDDFAENARLIPYDMRPKGAEVPFRCCIHKERKIIKDRAIASLGFPIEEDDDRKLLHTYALEALEREQIDNKNLTVLQEACKGCLENNIFVTDLCQGCVAQECKQTCRFGAIEIKDGRSVIDKTKCKKCGMCVNACPYKAIVKRAVPCEDACPVGAIGKDDNGLSVIDYEKCIRCGKCIMSCPFGSIHEKSQIIDILKAMDSDKKVTAMVAPSIAGQFDGSIYQIKTALMKAGFDDVVEVALGADITTHNEAKEFIERMEKQEPFMTTSCCAGYNLLTRKHLPEIKPYVSTTKTPMQYTAELLKKENSHQITVFVSPCVAKRSEGFEDNNVDYVMSFEEVDALFEAKNIIVKDCEETKYNKESSKQARNFSVTGGVADSVAKALKDDSGVKPYVISGINKDSIKKLKSFAKNGCCEDGCNLVEVMCCEGGCIAGNGTVNDVRKAKKQINTLLENSEDIEKI